jgi:hypothetical protein
MHTIVATTTSNIDTTTQHSLIVAVVMTIPYVSMLLSLSLVLIVGVKVPSMFGCAYHSINKLRLSFVSLSYYVIICYSMMGGVARWDGRDGEGYN